MLILGFLPQHHQEYFEKLKGVSERTGENLHGGFSPVLRPTVFMETVSRKTNVCLEFPYCICLIK